LKDISSVDIENATKAWHSSKFLSQELQALASSDNKILAELASRDLESVVAIELKLKRLVSLLE
jgi:hypothetical protein